MTARLGSSALPGAAFVMVATLALAQPASAPGRPPQPVAIAGRPAGPLRPAMLHIERDLAFSDVAGHTLHLDLYLRDTPDKSPLPVVVWVHGGDQGKSPTPAARLVANGYAVASIEYRSTREAPFPAQLFDAKAAVRWLRANAVRYNLDPDHIGAWGEGDGAEIATLLGVTGEVKALEGLDGNLDRSSRVQAVADFFGRADPSLMGSGLIKPTASAAMLTTARPEDAITYVKLGDPPFFIAHGTADVVVSPRQSEVLETALKHAGVDADLEYASGAGHDMAQVETPAIANGVDLFFDRTLRGGRHQRDTVAAIAEPPDSWVDPFADNLPGTRYELYDTPTRGPNTQASYRVYLPPDYGSARNARRRYPVIYYLHGFGDDSRSGVAAGYVDRADTAIRGGVMPPAIIIMVQAPNASGYVDNANGKFPAQTVLVKDLISHVDGTYRTVSTRDGRAIEGHSMGGSGAMQLAFKFPELFSSVSTFSAALVDNTGDARITRERFGGDAALSLAETPWALAARNADRIRGHMTIRMICGDSDSGGMVKNLWMSGVLDQLHIPHAFLIPKGASHPVKDILARLDEDPFAYYATVFPNR